jgi:glycosyltransferase involved in cell wall biosynthesis
MCNNDGSQQIAERCGARVVPVEAKGYGAALQGGIAAARGRYVIMGDADDGYDFSNLMPFVEKLREGYELVMGNRFKGGVAPGAMPPLHKYLGNPVLTWIGLVLVVGGLVGSVWAVWAWGAVSFADLDPQKTLRVEIPSVLLLTIGFQVILSSFFLSILGLSRNRNLTQRRFVRGRAGPRGASRRARCRPFRRSCEIWQ